MYETPVKDRTVLALVLSIIGTLFGFCVCFPLPTGIAAIVFAALAMSAKGNNDFAKMERQQRISLILSIVSIAIGLALVIAYIVFVLIAGLSHPPV